MITEYFPKGMKEVKKKVYWEFLFAPKVILYAVFFSCAIVVSVKCASSVTIRVLSMSLARLLDRW